MNQRHTVRPLNQSVVYMQPPGGSTGPSIYPVWNYGGKKITSTAEKSERSYKLNKGDFIILQNNWNICHFKRWYFKNTYLPYGDWCISVSELSEGHKPAVEVHSVSVSKELGKKAAGVL